MSAFADLFFKHSSLRANGSRECAPNHRLREAIHCCTKKEAGLLRRFAPRNDGTPISKYDSAIPRRDAPEFLQKPYAQKNRGRRECRVLDAPAASRAIVK
jgi:hypothetical protein